MVDDELNQNQAATPEGKEPDGDASRLAELTSQIAQKETALALAKAHITELEQALAESGEKLRLTGNHLTEAIVSYKALVTRANPEVPEDLISGDSIETINQSLEQARGLISRVKQGLEAEFQAARVPAGAPQRQPPDLSGLSPREKIQYSIGGKR